MKKLFALLFILAAGSASAGIIEFTPPNDQDGRVWTTNTNDGWGSGRGLVFQMTADETIDSIGIYQDLTGINLQYELAQVVTANGNVTSGQTVLASGNSTVTTSGLEWIDFDLDEILLGEGNIYHLEFTFSGNSNQNFFYNNSNQVFSQESFSLLDGTAGGSTSNYVMPALRVNTIEGEVPEPSILLLFGLGIFGLGLFARRK